MKRVAILITILILLGAWVIWALRPSGDRSVLRLRDNRTISFREMLSDLKSADLVFIGEDHDNYAHHEAELKIISALHEADVPFAIGAEMFRSEDQKELDLWTSGKLDPDTFIRLYYASWQMPWPLYGDIFLYSRDHHLPLIGLNIPGSVSDKIFSEGFGSLTPPELKQLPPGITCSVDPKYMELIRRAYSSHHSAGKPFLHFCEAQMVWDKAMAWKLIDYRKRNPSIKIVVLAGTGHSWKHGIPRQMTDVSGYSFRVVLPAPQAMRGPSAIGPAEADYIMK